MNEETPRICTACRASTMTRDHHPICTACGTDLSAPPRPPFLFSHWGQSRGRLVDKEVWVRVGGSWRVLGKIS